MFRVIFMLSLEVKVGCSEYVKDVMWWTGTGLGSVADSGRCNNKPLPYIRKLNLVTSEYRPVQVPQGRPWSVKLLKRNVKIRVFIRGYFLFIRHNHKSAGEFGKLQFIFLVYNDLFSPCSLPNFSEREMISKIRKPKSFLNYRLTSSF